MKCILLKDAVLALLEKANKELLLTLELYKHEKNKIIKIFLIIFFFLNHLKYLMLQ